MIKIERPNQQVENQTCQFTYKKSTIHYASFGKGEKKLIAFHGFGQNHYTFKPFEAILTDYTIYSFDLFFHGRSEWGYGESTLEKEDWKEMMTRFITEHHIDRFSLLGFSMGGKFALVTTEIFASQVDELFLIAPDGIKRRFWYTLATHFFFKRYFKLLTIKPHIFHNLALILEKLRIVKKWVIRFAASQMNSSAKRRKVYDSWIVFKKIKIKNKNIIYIINKNKIKLITFIGKYDKIIKYRPIQKFSSKIQSSKLNVLECGHHHMIEHTINYLKKGNY